MEANEMKIGKSEIIIYQGSNGNLDVRLEGETIWLTQKQIAELFGIKRPAITKHFYLVTKNHSFSDGNKRIAAFLFLWFLEKNRILYRNDGSRLIVYNTLVALTLMIAESRTEEKDVMVKVVVNLINKNN